MNIKKSLQELKRRINLYDKNAKNPFLEYNYAYNPFKSAISQTYVWVEKVNSKEYGSEIGRASCRERV